MIIPPHLKQGSTIAVVGTARFADEKEIHLSKKVLEEQGFIVIIAPNVTHSYNRFAGDDEERTRVLQLFLDNPSIDAIWLARGGYGTVRIIDALNWKKFLKHPKWLIGFSDFTLMHLKLQQLKVASIHACTFVQVHKFGIGHENVISVLELLLNQNRKYIFPGSRFNKEGKAEGKLVGGNLSLISNSMGTPSQINTDDCILLLEDCDEYLYHYDRMLHQLKRAGLLKELRGLIIGESTFKPEPDDIDFGYSIEEMVLNVCKEYNYPVCFNAPFGHTEKNLGLYLNTAIKLDVTKENATLVFV